MTDKLKALHSEWCRLTGQDPQKVRYQACERYFWDFFNHGYELEDLKVVLTFVIHQNSKREARFRTHLNLHALFSDMGKLASLIGEAHAWHRNRIKPPSPRDQALTQLRGTTEPAPETKTRTFGEVLKGIQL